MKGFIVFPALPGSKNASSSKETALEIDAIDSVSVSSDAGWVTSGPNRAVRVAQEDVSLIASAIAEAAVLAQHEPGHVVQWDTAVTYVEKYAKGAKKVQPDPIPEARKTLTNTFAYGTSEEAVAALMELFGSWGDASRYYEAITLQGVNVLWDCFTSVEPHRTNFPWHQGPLSALVAATSHSGMQALLGASSAVRKRELQSKVLDSGVGDRVHQLLREKTDLSADGGVK